jgi:hypothetical protein
MLSDATLNRVSSSYRRGYRDAEAGRPPQNAPVETCGGVPMKPFSDFDYNEGWNAGANDAYWAYVRSNGLQGSQAGRNEWIEARRKG